MHRSPTPSTARADPVWGWANGADDPLGRVLRTIPIREAWSMGRPRVLHYVGLYLQVSIVWDGFSLLDYTFSKMLQTWAATMSRCPMYGL